MGLAAGPVVPSREWRDLYARAGLRGRRRASIRSTPPVDPRVRCRRPAGRRLRPGRRRRHRGLARRDRRGRRRRRRTRSTPPSARPAGDPRRAGGASPIKARITRLGLRGLGAAGRPPADRGRRRGALCRHRLPAHAAGARPTAMARGAAAPTCSTAPRSSRTSRRCSEFKPDLASAPRRWCRRRRSWRSRRSTSPTWSRRGRCSGRPAPARWRIVTPRLADQSRFDAMEEFFGGVGEGHAAGYGWTDVAEGSAGVPRAHTAQDATRQAKTPQRRGD